MHTHRYMLFCKESRAEIKEKNPEVEGNKALMVLMGAKWKDLTKEAKAVFDEEAAEQKKMQDAKIAAYVLECIPFINRS